MSKPITLAVDAMGGDDAPAMVLKGCAIAAVRYPNVTFQLYGQQAQLEPLLRGLKKLDGKATIHHCDGVITNDMKASAALRQSKNSSMRLAIEAVAQGTAQAAISAGNTGALMALSKLVLGMVAGVDRPAIASFFPTMRAESVMLDLGANISCDEHNLTQFAMMGEAFARATLHLAKPSVGLLNVGSEDMKGHEEVRLAAALLREIKDLNFHGFIEGNDIPAGTVDVVVTDGFTGNVALKTAEGVGRLYGNFMKQTFTYSWLAKLGYLIAKSAFNKLRARVDPRRYNGAVLLGLKGISVKSHGGTDAFGFATAIGVAVDMVDYDFIEALSQRLTVLHQPTTLTSATVA